MTTDDIESEFFVADFAERCRKVRQSGILSNILMTSSGGRPVSHVDLGKFREGARLAAAWHAKTFGSSQNQ